MIRKSISVLLVCLCLFLFFGCQTIPRSSIPSGNNTGYGSIENTVWILKYEINGTKQNYEVHFLGNNKFVYNEQNDISPDNDFWEQNGDNVIIRINDSYSVYTGRLISIDRIVGTAKNIQGVSWNFEIVKKQ
jgi:hypothetical protein